MALQLIGRVQEGFAGQPAGAAAGDRHRRRPDRHRHDHRGRRRTTRSRSRSSSSAGRRWRPTRASEAELAKLYDAEEAEIAREFLEHGRAVRAERARAAAAGETARLRAAGRHVGRRLAGLPPRHGGQPGLPPEPRGDHQVLRGGRPLHREPVAAGLRPRRARRAAGGRVRAAGHDRGELRGTRGDAAGAQPVRRGRHVAQRHLRARAPGLVRDRHARPRRSRPSAPCSARTARSAGARRRASEIGFFTSYIRDGRTVSFYGDNHPIYAGSVVRAMASAKDGAPHVEALFAQGDRGAGPGGAAGARRGLAGVRGAAGRRLAAHGRARRSADADDRRGRRARARGGAPLRARAVLPAAELRGAGAAGRIEGAAPGDGGPGADRRLGRQAQRGCCR